jgi:two-component system, chemotaxis family, protein-glutamate methylesterase/glutaminase
MVRVLLVDDSAIVRQSLQAQLSQYANIEVVGTATDPYVARDKILKLRPDVMVLDVEMPRMDGLTFLQKIMAHLPLPVIILSALTAKGSQMAIQALEYGAFDVLAKPSGSFSLGEITQILAQQILAANSAKNSMAFRNTYAHLDSRLHGKTESIMQKSSVGITQVPSSNSSTRSLSVTTRKILAIGASTGGTRVIEYILRSLPRTSPPVVMTQHMPIGFTTAFAERLNMLSALDVAEGQDGEILTPGCAYLAPANYHMEVVRAGGNYQIVLHQGERLHYQRPAVDYLFASLAKYAGKNASAALCTGMGKDGAIGLLEMKKAGGYTIAQDEATSVVWGMPGAAVAIDAAQDVLPVQKIAQALLSSQMNQE